MGLGVLLTVRRQGRCMVVYHIQCIDNRLHFNKPIEYLLHMFSKNLTLTFWYALKYNVFIGLYHDKVY